MNKFSVEMGVDDPDVAKPPGAKTLFQFEDWVYSEWQNVKFSYGMLIDDQLHSIVLKLIISNESVVLECDNPFRDPHKHTIVMSQLIKSALIIRHDNPKWGSVPIFIKNVDATNLIPVVGFEIVQKSNNGSFINIKIP